MTFRSQSSLGIPSARSRAHFAMTPDNFGSAHMFGAPRRDFDVPMPRSRGTLTAFHDSFILFGGCSPLDPLGDRLRNDVHIITPLSDSQRSRMAKGKKLVAKKGEPPIVPEQWWLQPTANAPLPRAHNAACTDGTHLFIHGGVSEDGSALAGLHAVLVRGDPVDSPPPWLDLCPNGPRLHSHAMVFWDDASALVIYGGYLDDGVPNTSVYIFWLSQPNVAECVWEERHLQVPAPLRNRPDRTTEEATSADPNQEAPDEEEEDEDEVQFPAMGRFQGMIVGNSIVALDDVCSAVVVVSLATMTFATVPVSFPQPTTPRDDTPFVPLLFGAAPCNDGNTPAGTFVAITTSGIFHIPTEAAARRSCSVVDARLVGLPSGQPALRFRPAIACTPSALILFGGEELPTTHLERCNIPDDYPDLDLLVTEWGDECRAFFNDTYFCSLAKPVEWVPIFDVRRGGKQAADQLAREQSKPHLPLLQSRTPQPFSSRHMSTSGTMTTPGRIPVWKRDAKVRTRPPPPDFDFYCGTVKKPKTYQRKKAAAEETAELRKTVNALLEDKIMLAKVKPKSQSHKAALQEYEDLLDRCIESELRALQISSGIQPTDVVEEDLADSLLSTPRSGTPAMTPIMRRQSLRGMQRSFKNSSGVISEDPEGPALTGSCSLSGTSHATPMSYAVRPTSSHTVVEENGVDELGGYIPSDKEILAHRNQAAKRVQRVARWRMAVRFLRRLKRSTAREEDDGELQERLAHARSEAEMETH